MSAKIKMFICGIMSVVFILPLCSCKNEIKGLFVEDLSARQFYNGIQYDDLRLYFEGASDYSQGDIVAVNSDNTVAEVTVGKRQIAFSSEYILFSINALKVGKTELYFETADGKYKTDSVEIEVLQNLRTISFADASEIVFDEEDTHKNPKFTFNAGEMASGVEKMLEFVSENSTIAKIEYDKQSVFSHRCIITPVSRGETYVYIRSMDGAVVSEKLKVTVNKEIGVTITIPESSEQSAVGTSPITSEVYITPSGKKYHKSKSCAGKNAIPVSLEEARQTHQPCKSCAK